MGAYRNWRYGVAIDMVGQTAVRFHGQIPGGPNIRGWVGMGTGADAPTEAAQEKSAPAMQDFGTEPVQRTSYSSPQQPRHPIAERYLGHGKWK
jgi:hypothetical protein